MAREFVFTTKDMRKTC